MRHGQRAGGGDGGHGAAAGGYDEGQSVALKTMLTAPLWLQREGQGNIRIAC